VLAPNKGEQRLNGIAISWGGCDVPGQEPTPAIAARKVLFGFLRGAARDVADPESRLKATPLIEAMHARVFSAALHQDVVTVLAPGRAERSVNNGASMTHPSKFRMGDHILEKAVPSSASQQIWRSDEHAACSDPCVHGGYEDRDAVVGQRFQPDLFGSLNRLRTGAHFRDPIELEQ
jgi:hypothetical protein